MSRFVRRLIYVVMGILGGVAAWPVLETAIAVQELFPSYLLFSLVAGGAFGAVFGAFSGAVDGMIAANYRRILWGALFGLGIGALGGAVGFLIGQGVLLIAAEVFLDSATNFETVGQPLAKAFGWAILGMFVASAEGIRRRSGHKTAIGVLGGFVGGLVGGAVLEYAPFIMAPQWARPVGLVLFGALVALFYGLVERRLSSGVLRLLNGPYKGKEFILNQRRLSIGTESGSDVYLGEYVRVKPHHATLRESQGELFLHPEEERMVKVNDERVTKDEPKLLKYEDVLQIGNAKMLFRPLVMLIALLLFVILPAADAAAQSVRVAQIDSGALLTRQRVDLYVSVTDGNGLPLESLEQSDFTVLESADGQEFTEVDIVEFTPAINQDEGITFFLLVDNSGSMYDRLDGGPAPDPDDTRMAAAVEAIRDFLAEIDNPRDRVALATFNTNYQILAEPTESIRSVVALLDQIEEPESEEAYTELYRAVASTAEYLESSPGRNVIVVLSDGENFPYAEHSGEPHPEYGFEEFTIDDTVEALQRRGSSVYAVNFATAGDRSFARIARENGGLVYDASDPGELLDVYSDIRDRTLREYRIGYRAGTSPAEQRYVQVVVNTRDGSARSTRTYFAGTLFGLPTDRISVLTFLPLLLALLIAALLTLVRIKNNRTEPNIEVINARGRATQIQNITSPKTVIGGSEAADVTIVGAPDVRDSHATIEYDRKNNTYTVVSTEPIQVNNQPTKRRKLSPGDVVQLPGATVVFDAPDTDESDT
ncbi:MAG: FHA domain-containing protein [Spirochaetales bacterium]